MRHARRAARASAEAAVGSGFADRRRPAPGGQPDRAAESYAAAESAVTVSDGVTQRVRNANDSELHIGQCWSSWTSSQSRQSRAFISRMFGLYTERYPMLSAEC